MDRHDADDEFERALRDLTSGKAPQPRYIEPSAAERARAAKNSAKAARKARRNARRPSRRWGTRVVAVIVLLAIGGIAYLRLGFSSSNDASPIHTGPVPPAVVASPAGPPSDPFAGSPAAAYEDGARGIVIPAARPVGGFTQSQVGAAYREVRTLLIATGLDWPTLRGGAPTAFTRLLVPDQRTDFVNGLNKVGLDKDGYALGTRDWVVSFAPGSTQFISQVIKVRGVMSASSVMQNGQKALRIQVNYLFVYAVAPPHDAPDWMRVVDQSYGYADFSTSDGKGGALEPWLTLWNAGAVAGNRCDVNDGFVHPKFPNSPPDQVQPSGLAVNPYAMSTADTRATCQLTTGT